MSYTQFKLTLSDEELQLPALKDLCDKYMDWLSLSKESEGGRKTRSSNKKADKIYDEVMKYTLPKIEVKLQPVECNNENLSRDVSIDSTANSDNSDSSSSSRPVTRSLRPRCRTPSPSSTRSATPGTPQNQRLRAHFKKPPSSLANSSNVLNQQHPSVSVTKIRQMIRADSAQKKRDQELERQERIRRERMLKEERAEAQKKQLLEERAITAKQKREQRLLHAAEVRKARELAKFRKNKPIEYEPPHETPQPIKPQLKELPPPPAPPVPKQQVQKPEPKKQAENVVLNETFKKSEINNVEIVIADTSGSVKGEVPQVATWARAPHLRRELVEQYQDPNRRKKTDPKQVMKIDPAPLKRIDLESMFGKSAGARHLKRTSSAVWTPPSSKKSSRKSKSMASSPTKF